MDSKVFTSVWADSLQSLVGFLLLEFQCWKDKPGKNIPTKLGEQQWEHIQPLESCFCITPSVLEMALGVCKLSLKIQTITLIFHSSKEVMKTNPDPQASVEEGMSAIPMWFGSITTSNT